MPLPAEAVGCCTVVEVLKDEAPVLGEGEGAGEGEGKDKRRFGWREQRWTAVEVSCDGLGLVGAFWSTGTGTRRRGLEKEGVSVGVSGLTEAGNVAKVWGFGGRRV